MYLHDLDPILTRTPAYMSEGWHHQMTELAEWAEPLGTPVTVPYSPYGALDWATGSGYLASTAATVISVHFM
jgi:hypothetical protein